MKSLSLVKPLIIVTVGSPRAGKSFFASKFSAMFGAPMVSSDAIRYELFNEPTYATDEQLIVSRIMNVMITEMMKTRKTFIIDGQMNTRQDRLSLRSRAHKAGYEVLIVWVQTDQATTRQRAFSTKHQQKASIQLAPLSGEAYESLTKRLTPPHVSESYVVISGKHTYPTQARMVLRKMTAPKLSRSIPMQADDQSESSAVDQTMPPAPEPRQRIIIRPDSGPPQVPPRRNLTIN